MVSLKKAVTKTSLTSKLVLHRVSSFCHSLFNIYISHPRRGGSTCQVKKSQSSTDIFVEEGIIDTTDKSD